MEIKQAATITKEELVNQVIEHYQSKCRGQFIDFLNRDNSAVNLFKKYNDVCAEKIAFLHADSENDSSVLFFIDEWCCHCSDNFFNANTSVNDVLLLFHLSKDLTTKIYLATNTPEVISLKPS
jgi:hypothetical protein